jgi:serine/threonine protein kinase
MSLEIDVTKSMCLKSVQQDAAIENRLQSIVTDWKTDEDEHQESSVNSSFNNSGNLDHLLTNQKLLVANANTRKAQDGANLNKTKLFLSFPLKRLYPLGRGASSIVYKTLKLNNLKIYAEKVLVVSDPVKKKQIIREIESLRSMFSQSPPTDENNPFTPYSKENNSDIYSPDKKQQQIPDLYTPKRIRAHCQYIVELYDVLQNPLDGTLSLCLEYMNNGSLQDIVSLGGCNDETILSSISYQILCGLQFLHSLRIVHRDVKPSNILLSLDGHIKLSDFGLAKTMDLGHSLADSFIGTFEYMAPERLSGELYSFSSDIYSFGLSVHTLALGRFPYDNKKGFWELLHITQQENKPLPSSELFSEEFIRFVSMSTNRNMKDRPSADQLMSFPFLQSKLDVVPPDLWNPFMKELEERKQNPQKVKASSQKPKKQTQPSEQEEELSPKKKNESPIGIITTNATSSRVGNTTNKKEPPSSLGIVTTGRKNTGSNTGRAAESLNIEERKKRHSFHHENNTTSSNRENSSKPPLPSARFVSPRVQSQQQQQTTGNKSSARSNESPSSSALSINNNRKPNASPRRLANNPSNPNNSNPNERKGGNSSTPRLLQQNSGSSSSTSGKFSGKQTSLPVIPTCNITTTTASNVSPKRNNVNNPVNNNKTNSSDNNNNNSNNKIPLIPLHRISGSNENKNEALHSLHPEKQLDNTEITNVVSEWARFVVKYFQYEMKQAKEQQYSNDSEDINNTQSSGKPGGGNSFSPEKRSAVPAFDKKSLFITKAVIKGLSSDLNCSEEKLLSLFQVKIKEIQQQLGDIIHYYDRTTQQQRRQEQQQQQKKPVKELTPVNRNYHNRSPERKKLPPNLLKEQEKKQQSLQLLVPQLQLESAQSAIPPTTKVLLSSPAVPAAPPQPSSSEKSTFHHQLTISLDPLKAVKKKSTKSIKDFGDEDLPTPGEHHLGSSSSAKKLNLETIANSAETLESFIELDTKEWETFQQSFRVGNNNKDILEIETSQKKKKTGRQSYDGGTQEMKTAMIRSLDSKLPDLTPPPSSSAKIRTSMSSSKELIKRKSAADLKEDLFNKGHVTHVHPTDETEEDQLQPAFRRSFPGKNPLLTSVSSDVALVTSSSNLLFPQNTNQNNNGGDQSTKNNDRDQQGSFQQHHFVRSQSDSTREIVGSSHHSMHDRSQRRKSREYYDQKKNDFEEMDSKRIPDKENHFYATNHENHSHSDIEEDQDIYKTNTRDYDEDHEEDNSDVLLDMSSILEESILLQQEKQQERNRFYGNILDEIAFTRHSSKNNTKRNSISGYSEVDDDYDYDNDDMGEGAAEEVASFNPSPFATPRESKYEPAKAVPSQQQKQSQRQEKHRNSAVEYSMVFDEIPSEAKKKNNSKMNENYDSDEFED